MKLSYSYHVFQRGSYGGISRYFYELATRISLFDNIDVEILAGSYSNKYLNNNIAYPFVKGFYLPHIPKTSLFVDYFNYFYSKSLLIFSKPDIIHETYYSHKRLAPSKYKTVVTIYDMIHEKLSDLLTDNYRLTAAKKASVDRADCIISISQSTKNDLVELFNVDPNKISVIHLGYSLQSKSSSDLPILKSPYILYVGSRNSYKNFNRLAIAYASKKEIRSNFKLVCFGQQPFSDAEKSALTRLGLDESSVISMSGDDNVLANLYQNASAFVYPSLYEGFGIPPLEAMSFSCPVICSNTSSIPEVVGDAGLFFDPYDSDSIAESLQKLLFSSEISEALIARGIERIRSFSWD